MTEYFNTINFIWIAIALITFFTLVFTKIRAPYGRHANTNWGKMMDNKWAWFVMEFPALIVMPTVALTGPQPMSDYSYLLISLWTLHYFNRTIIFPIRIRTKGKKMPLTIVFSALFFNSVNGLLNGYFLGYITTKSEVWSDWTTYVGLLIFVAGLLINQITDTKLINLRKEKKGYQIPKKWLFDYISCPNHFGETVEWIGFAIIACSIPGWTFAIWTFCNLIPRALNHHQWYNEKFEDYPKSRKAVIPFIW